MEGTRQSFVKEGRDVEDHGAHQELAIDGGTKIACPRNIRVGELGVRDVATAGNGANGHEEAGVCVLRERSRARASAHDHGIAKRGFIGAPLGARLPLIDEAHRAKTLGERALSAERRRDEEHGQHAAQRETGT